MAELTISAADIASALKNNLELEPLVVRDPPLLNIYGVMEVNPQRFPRVNHAGARAFADFLLAEQTQAIIKTFGTAEHGEPLFYPSAGQQESQLTGAH